MKKSKTTMSTTIVEHGVENHHTMATTNMLVTQINLQHCKEASSLMSHLINKELTTVVLI